MTELTEKRCQACEAGTPKLSIDRIHGLLTELDNWQLNDATTQIARRFTFKTFSKTMAFTNAVAWIANQEGHHPELQVSYNACVVEFTTHALNGLSENDFICAAKVDALLK